MFEAVEVVAPLGWAGADWGYADEDGLGDDPDVLFCMVLLSMAPLD